MATAAIDQMRMNENGYLLDPRTGASFLTNATGLTILKAVKEGLLTCDIVDALVTAFDVAPALAERDVIDFMDLCRAKGVIA